MSRQARRARTIYGNAEIYDKAFSYRNFDAETNFLLDLYGRFSSRGGLPRSVLEVASGTGRHSLELVRRGIRQVALVDKSKRMLDRARTAFLGSTATVEFISADIAHIKVAKK